MQSKFISGFELCFLIKPFTSISFSSVTAEKWVPIVEVPVNSIKHFLERKKHEGFCVLGLEQTANSIPLDQYMFPKKTVHHLNLLPLPISRASLHFLVPIIVIESLLLNKLTK